MIKYTYTKKVCGKNVAVLVRQERPYTHMRYDKQSLQARIETLKERGADTSAEEKALKLLEEVEE